MPEMSPLLRLVLIAIQYMTMLIAALLLGVVGLFVWQQHGADGFHLTRADWGLLGLLVALLAFALYMVIGLRRELKATRKAE